MSETMTIRVGERPAALGALGTYFDGETSAAQPARLRIEESQAALVIEVGGRVILWPLKNIRRVPDQALGDNLVLALAGDPVARLVTDEHRIAQRCPNLRRRNSHVKRSKILTWSVGALASVALIILVLVPKMADQLAEYIPPDGERALGETTLSQIRTALSDNDLVPIRGCANVDGFSALVKLQERLQKQSNITSQITVHVLDHKMINAFALPGGHIVFFKGLIEAAETPEELAAVFAHEMGHVVSRDPTRHALRSAGSIGVLGLLFGDFAGGALVLFLTERLIDAQYSQRAEIDADVFGMDMLENAEVDPGALGAMFQRLLDKHGEADGTLAHFITHPKLSERIAASQTRQAEVDQTDFVAQPLLSDDDWAALKNICSR
ncbi:M48 family metallopeptidase [Cognatishimia sp. WU-CL00825]|uniref:M48 family metallopeptidase n=1 Tax=Cognatishimia sp. WU-CL00825 TaxID=3127658 RepID=UPI003106B17F